MSNLPEYPVSRVEQYLSNIAGQSAPLPEWPMSRVELYLAYIIEHGTEQERAIAAQVQSILATLPHKADLIGGFVPASQISGQTLENYPVDTYADLPAQGNVNYLYIVHDENDQQYRWVGGSTSAYIKAGEKDAYYVAEVMGLTTMGELRQFIEGINQQQLHVLLDMHTYVTDAYVCTAHFYTTDGVQHCEIFDLLNSQLIAGSFADTDAIAAFVAAGKSKLATVVKYASVLPSTAELNTIYSLGTVNAVTTALPNGTKVGDMVSIIWYNGATPATVTITGQILPFSFTPTASFRSEISAMWDGANWSLVAYEQAVV